MGTFLEEKILLVPTSEDEWQKGTDMDLVDGPHIDPWEQCLAREGQQQQQ